MIKTNAYQRVVPYEILSSMLSTLMKIGYEDIETQQLFSIQFEASEKRKKAIFSDKSSKIPLYGCQ
jgi:hypothetical protein